MLLMDKVPESGQKLCDADSVSSVAPWRMVNIGNADPVKLIDFVNEIEIALNMKAEINFMPLQMGDVVETFANNELLKDLTSYAPQTNYKEGIKKFVDWYKSYYLA